MHKIVKNTKSLSFGVVYYMVMANGHTVFSGSSNSGTKFPQVKMSLFFLDWIICKDVFISHMLGITKDRVRKA